MRPILIAVAASWILIINGTAFAASLDGSAPSTFNPAASAIPQLADPCSTQMCFANGGPAKTQGYIETEKAGMSVAEAKAESIAPATSTSGKGGHGHGHGGHGHGHGHGGKK